MQNEVCFMPNCQQSSMACIGDAYKAYELVDRLVHVEE